MTDKKRCEPSPEWADAGGQFQPRAVTPETLAGWLKTAQEASHKLLLGHWNWPVMVRSLAEGYTPPATVAALVVALDDLLADTQHATHDCGDDDCPVRRSRAALALYRGEAGR